MVFCIRILTELFPTRWQMNRFWICRVSPKQSVSIITATAKVLTGYQSLLNTRKDLTAWLKRQSTITETKENACDGYYCCRKTDVPGDESYL